VTTCRRALPLGLALVALSCTFGQSVLKYEPAHSPRGVTARITTASDRPLVGELIEVRDAGLVVGNEAVIALVPYAVVKRAAFVQTRLSLEAGQAPDRSTREKLRLLSRFPQGLSPALLQELLEAHGQSELTQVAR
jgi:hypothetical protein